MRSSAVALSLPVLLGSFSAARPTRSTAAPTHGCAALAPGNAPRAVANDNRRRAGRWRGDTLVVSLVASRVAWYPEAEDGCALPVLAFAEAGRAPSVPGPLLRVRAGTQLRVAVRNGTGRALWLRGFNDHPAATRAGVELAPDSTREFRFVAKAPGTYAYGATLAPYPEGGATVRPVRDDSQLLGAFVVDNAQSSGTRDRVLVITRWTIRDPGDSTRPPLFYVSAVNGKSWPYTERLAYGVGDSIRWRVVNGSLAAHPMHLHGFYFDVLARGTFARDTVLARPRTVVTEPLPVGQTMELRWRAERPGNWLFHCHLLAHMSAVQRLDRMSDSALHTLGVAAAGAAPGTASPMAMGAMRHAMEDMAGLIVGVQILPHAPTSRTALPQPPRRTLHLFADQRADVFGPGVTGYGFVLQEGASAPAPDSIRRPGSTLVLRRGEPVRIVVVNRLTMPLSVRLSSLTRVLPSSPTSNRCPATSSASR